MEFTLVGSFIFLPMLAGLATVGMSMVMSMQVASLNSAAGQMYSSGVDFTQAANVSILQKVAGNLNLGAGGNGGVILTQIQGVVTDPVSQTVVETCTNQVIIGSPNQGSQYVSGGQGGTVTAAFTALFPTLAAGQTVYVAESSFSNAQYAWAFAPAGGSTGIYVKAFY